ncbi:MAG: MerR family transcriptional regulator [Jhaorihella sp.]
MSNSNGPTECFCGRNHRGQLDFHQMCAAFGLTPRTLRYYEYLELITSDHCGRNRYYDDRAQARIKLILRGKSFGMRLEMLRQWLDLYQIRGQQEQMRRWLSISRKLRMDLERSQLALEQALSDLDQADNEAMALLGQ